MSSEYSPPEGANKWMVTEGLASSGPEKPRETASAPEKRTVTSAVVQGLARRLGKDPESLAKKLPQDTVRRTKYPSLISRDADGRLIFKHDPGVSHGRHASTKK